MQRKSISALTKDVEPTLDEDSVESRLHQGRGPAGHDEVMAGGDGSEAAQRHEEDRPHGPVLRGSEPVHHGDDDGDDAQQTDGCHVDQPSEELTVETVVEPGHEAPHSEETDADVVKFAEQFGDVFGVTADCVEQ